MFLSFPKSKTAVKENAAANCAAAGNLQMPAVPVFQVKEDEMSPVHSKIKSIQKKTAETPGAFSSAATVQRKMTGSDRQYLSLQSPRYPVVQRVEITAETVSPKVLVAYAKLDPVIKACIKFTQDMGDFFHLHEDEQINFLTLLQKSLPMLDALILHQAQQGTLMNAKEDKPSPLNRLRVEFWSMNRNFVNQVFGLVYKNEATQFYFNTPGGVSTLQINSLLSLQEPSPVKMLKGPETAFEELLGLMMRAGSISSIPVLNSKISALQQSGTNTKGANSILQLAQTLMYCRQLLLSGKDQEKLMYSLLILQLHMQQWKSHDPDSVIRCLTLWDNLTRESTALISSITSDRMGSQKEGMTGMELAKAKEAELTSMAVRITASNSPQYHASESEQRPAADGGGTFVDFAWERQKNKREVDSKLNKEGIQPIAPLMRGNTIKRIEMNAKTVEKNLEAVCTEFAQLAAVTLNGFGVRVEIIGSMKTNHNWVVLGRPLDSKLEDTGTWGNTVAIVDCWWGAMYWESYHEIPKVIYQCWEHTDTYKNEPQSCYWDSNATQQVNEGAQEENNFSFNNIRALLSGKRGDTKK